MRTRSLVVGYFPAIFLTKSDAPHYLADNFENDRLQRSPDLERTHAWKALPRTR